MNPVKVARDMGQIAGAIATVLNLDAAAILTIDDKNVACFFGGTEALKPKEMIALLKVCADYFTRMVKELEEGKSTPIDIDKNTKGFLNIQKLDEEDPPIQFGGGFSV